MASSSSSCDNKKLTTPHNPISSSHRHIYTDSHCSVTSSSSPLPSSSTFPASPHLSRTQTHLPPPPPVVSQTADTTTVAAAAAATADADTADADTADADTAAADTAAADTAAADTAAADPSASSSSCTEGFDDLFDSLVTEVNRLPVRGPVGGPRRIQVDAVPTKNSKKLGSAEEECERLASGKYKGGGGGSYEALQIGHDAGEDEIKRQYKKISLLIHPDKCKHPMAQEAFQVVTKAYEELQRPDMRARYQKVIEEARKKVLKERRKENKLRSARKEVLLGTTEEDMADAVAQMCDKLLNEQEDMRTYADSCRAANDRYEKAQEANTAMDEMKEMEKKRKWNKERNERVGSWRDFRTQVETKKVKLHAFVAPIHKKEQRPAHSAADTNDSSSSTFRKNKLPMGIDESYKKNWR
eukprot:GHVQ01001704.1.p1 GENE.GHVQ01001704.1~~GHVQ01001704.1.p1  ORF type:complete len:484 (+),score=214.64 GHVQ01001704.1:212-1453(+)